jgi:hypothetical protein
MPGITAEQAAIYAQLFQDIELSRALGELKNNPQALQAYLQQSQVKLYNDVTSAKDESIQKVYGDLQRASDTGNAIYYYYKRNTDLDKLQAQVYDSQKGSANAVLHDRDLAKRQYEINQWSSSNKMDSLFVYSQLFIILCTVSLLVFVSYQGILPPMAIAVISLIVIIIFIFTIVNRSQYTNFLRDGRFWNRRKFPVYNPVPTPNICETNISASVQSGLTAAEEKSKAFFAGTASSFSKGLNTAASGLQSAAGNLASAAK